MLLLAAGWEGDPVTIDYEMLTGTGTMSDFDWGVGGLNAKAMTDEELARATKPYRLMRIRRTEARTGPGGPGDLAWVWPLATLVLLPLALRSCWPM